MSHPRFLGVLLCYNDGDILGDAIRHLLNNDHNIVVWNHGSTDETASVLDGFRNDLLEVTQISREVDFYDLYPTMSKHLLSRYIRNYDWVSWPDQDELLEGPTRAKSYRDFLEEAVQSNYDWIVFRDFVYWYTERDDASMASPCDRLKYYSLSRLGAPKVRSWRASSTNIRWFNHNAAQGSKCPGEFNLRHYPMRSELQMRRRVLADRSGIKRGPLNWHYENLRANIDKVKVSAEDLHFDDGKANLRQVMKFDWRRLYGVMPPVPRAVEDSYNLRNRRWQIAGIVRDSLATLPPAPLANRHNDRIVRWLRKLEEGRGVFVLIVIQQGKVRVVTEDIARQWELEASGNDPEPEQMDSESKNVTFETSTFTVRASARGRSVELTALTGESHRNGGHTPPLVTLAPMYGGDTTRVAELQDGKAEFNRLTTNHYLLAVEPVSCPVSEISAVRQIDGSESALCSDASPLSRSASH